MTPLWLTIACAAVLAVRAFLAGTEFGAHGLNRIRLRVRRDQGDPAARTLASLLQQPESMVITTLTGLCILDYLLATCVAALLIHWLGGGGSTAVILYTGLIAAPLIVIFGSILPREWFRRDADRLMYPAAAPLAAIHGLARASGTIALLSMLTRSILRRLDPRRLSRGEDVLPRSRMLSLLHEGGAAAGGLSRFQRETMDRVTRVSQIRVNTVMVPRTRVAMLPSDAPREDVLRVARMAHFARLPIYDRESQRVIGVLNVYDLLMDEQPRPVLDYVRPAVTVLPAETVPQALLRLQQARQVMAIVTDAAGHCVGVLTIKDLVEEVVGELDVW